jgi:predicted nucleic acid-binding Zn finger protein
MAKCMKSQYLGLWKSERSGWYLSKPILKKKLAESKDRFRIIMRYNKYHNPENNTPKFIFALADEESTQNITEIQLESDEFQNIMDSIKRIQEIAYNGDVNDSGSLSGYNEAKNACNDIDMICREILDKFKEDDRKDIVRL